MNDLVTDANAARPVVAGGTGATSAAGARANLGLTTGTFGFLYGLTLSNNGSDATNDIDIAVGTAAEQDVSNPSLITLASALTKRLDAAWAVGTNQGGLDTGSIANTTYHVWLIQRSDTGVVDALFSTSATAPTMPVNYDRKRRVGSIMRVSAAIKAFRQVGDVFSWVTSVIDRSSTSSVASALLALTIPSGVIVRPIMTLSINTTTTINISNILGDAAAGSTSVAVQTLLTNATSASDTTTVDQFFSNTSSQIYFACSGSGTIGSNTLTTIGYIDTRGRI